MDAIDPSSAALVLAGAVARGAFEAGAVEALLESGREFSRIVATSSGALNGLILASGLRSGRALEKAQLLARLWREDADLAHSFHLSLMQLLARRGFSDQSALIGLLKRNVSPADGPGLLPVHFKVVLTALNGIPGRIGANPATTYEKALDFADADFDSAEKIEEMILACAAAASFPGVYSPIDIPGLGPCTDGGAVNNTPIRYSLAGENIHRIYIVVPVPYVVPPPESLSGLSQVGHLADILVNERLYRDLRDAYEVNRQLAELRELVEQGKLTQGQLDAVLATLRWRDLEIVEIRPREPLRGNPFSGFLSSDLRAEHVELGRQAALAALSS